MTTLQDAADHTQVLVVTMLSTFGVGGFVRWLYSLVSTTANRDRLRELLVEPAWLDQYQVLLGGFQKLLQSTLGSPRGLRSFGTCLAIALTYPLLFFFVAYAVGGSHALAGAEILPESNTMRLPWLLGVVAFLVLEITVSMSARRLDFWFGQKVRMSSIPWLVRLSGGVVCGGLLTLALWLIDGQLLSPDLGLITATAIAVAGAGAGALAVATAVTFAIAVGAVAANAGIVSVSVAGAIGAAIAGAGSFAAAIAVAGGKVRIGTGGVPGAVVVAFIFAFASTVIFALFRAGSGSAANDLALFSFVGMLPIINGVLDWSSWRVSRFFVDQARRQKRWGWPFLHVLIDLGLALLFMVGVAVLLPSAVDALAILHVEEGVSLNWRALAIDARQAPWGQGIMVTFMILTTLIPTALHILCGVAALVLHWMPKDGFARHLQRMDDATRRGHGNRLDRDLAFLWLLGWLLASAGLCASIWIAVSSMLHVADYLYDIAEACADPRWLFAVPLICGLTLLPLPGE